MQYLLNETEYRAYLQMQEALNLKTIANMALEAEVASLSSKMKEVMRDCKGSAKALADARAEVKRLQELADERLVSMHNLSNEVRCLRAKRFCVVKNSQTGTVKVISAGKADLYRQFGWTVIEEFLVDRPA